MAISFTFDVKSRTDRFGKHSIYLRITQNKDVKRIKTSVSVTLKPGCYRDEILCDKSKWVKNCFLNKDAIQEAREVKMLNEILSNELRAAKAKYEELKLKGIASASKIQCELKSGGSSESFNDFLDRIIQELEQAGRIADWKKFVSFQRKWLYFLKSRLHQDISFREIDSAMLMDFESHLRTLRNERNPEKMLHPNTIKLQFVIMQRVINKALEAGKINPTENPFIVYKLPKEDKTFKQKLTSSEIRLIEDAELKPGTLMAVARDIFLFSFYCAGIRFEDVAMMRCSNIQEGRISYTMAKNGKRRDLKLIPQALGIITTYKNEDARPTDYLFPLLKDEAIYSDVISYEDLRTLPIDKKKVLFQRIGSRNALINKELKKLAKMVGIEKNVSFHIARHSFASEAKNKGISGTQIKGLLAHSKLDTTERYMGEFDTDTNDSVLDEIFTSGSPKAELFNLINRMNDDEISEVLKLIKKSKPSLL